MPLAIEFALVVANLSLACLALGVRLLVWRQEQKLLSAIGAGFRRKSWMKTTSARCLIL
jgi:hypothetical protein